MIFLKVKLFLQSLWFHISRGLPKCNQEEILNRYNICLSCEHFNALKNQCNICGCYLSRKKQFLNKLAWADQKCPENKWDVIIRK